MVTPGNAINEATTGICGFTGTAFTGTAATNHAVLVGGSTSSTLTNLSVGATGTVLQGATGADPAFTATPSVTSITLSGGTALNNYTEGTFTPTLVGGSVAGTTTYGNQQGYYTRIGNLVFVQARISLSAATGTGDITLGGLPFTIKNQTNGYVAGGVYFGGGASWPFPIGTTSLTVLGVLNTTTAVIFASGSAVGGSDIQMANAALVVIYSFCYQI
jgi:hypothetical protein